MTGVKEEPNAPFMWRVHFRRNLSEKQWLHGICAMLHLHTYTISIGHLTAQKFNSSCGTSHRCSPGDCDLLLLQRGFVRRNFQQVTKHDNRLICLMYSHWLSLSIL
jgi:hypothetical protein